MADSGLEVEVVFAAGESPAVRLRLRVADGTTIVQAIAASGIGSVLPEGVISPDRLGIHGRRVAAHQVLREGDRVEICRPLVLDPMEARRRRSR